MILPINPRRTPSGSRVESGRPKHKASVAVESLEGRELLAHGAFSAHALVGAHAAISPPVFLGVDPGPIRGTIGPGYAVKVPRFYSHYFGQRIAEINGASTFALISPSGKNLLLSGEMAGQIPSTTPAGTADYFIFGINRGGAAVPGPFPGKPGISFDAVVAVAVTPAGIGGVVFDINTNTTTPLPASSVIVNADTIHVIAPLSALPSTGFSPRSYQVNLFTADTLPDATNFQHIASFLPEFRSFTVRQARRFPPNFGPPV